MFFFITDTAEIRSKLKRKCRMNPSNSFNKNSCNIPRREHKRILTQILQLQDYNKEIQPNEIKPSQIETFGALSEIQINDIFNRIIFKQTIRNIIIDTLKVFLPHMKLCYLFNPIMQAIETEIQSTRDEYRIRDVLRIIVKGEFYQYLHMKTQASKFLFNNRTTEVNVKTILSSIIITAANKLTIKGLSDVVLFYRLQEALYQTAPNGLPFEFQKIIKAIKKVDRNITAQKFAKWQKRMIAVDKDVKFLEPYHFIYLMSLSEPISKKRQNFFQAERRESKLEKHSQLMSLMKEKNNFISAETHKTNWKNEIKIRGLSYQHPTKTQQIKSIEKQFVDLRKRIISHKRVKSAVITAKAVEMVKSDLKKNNLEQNQKILNKEYLVPKQPQKQRTRLKKHNKLWVAMKQFQECKKQQTQKFSNIYKRELNKHTIQKWQIDEETRENEEQGPIQDANAEENQGQKMEANEIQEIVDIYSHHLSKILNNFKHRSLTKTHKLSKIQQSRENMLKWL